MMKMLQWWKDKLNPETSRNRWVISQIESLPPGKILDAGCGSQRYRASCGHLQYFAQDLGEFGMDEKSSFTVAHKNYVYGPLDYRGNIWDIPASSASFDYLLCTEVFEHIPYPNETVREFARLLKPGGGAPADHARRQFEAL